ncbi:MAG: sigma-54-dependent Fis family transcriptional regulator [Deltaproteobacteria bacterium]|nr:sigma-54-dependent Fis family transcriptional regulator [Deltaproteobacteria bacterium]
MSKRKPNILVVDDGLTYARVVADHLPELRLVTPDGQPCLRDGPSALAWLDRHVDEVDLVLLDMHFDVPDEKLLPLPNEPSLRRQKRFQGVAILREIRHRHPALPVVLLTAEQDLSLVDVDGQLAAQSMTYVLDGEDLDTLRIRINAALQEASQGLEEDDLLWGGHRAMAAIRRRLEVLSRGSMPVIIEGETGTGKSFLAERYLHRKSGRKGAFVTLDLSAVPTELVASHLFGALRGSFTGAVADRKGVFELAHHGTLFIDEIQNVPIEVQKQLLVVLQERKVRPIGAAREIDVDVKVVAASNQPLALAVAEGRFRQDLYMRLGPATRVVIPPLRERLGDLPFFARRIVTRAAEDPENAPLKAEVARAAGLTSEAPMHVLLGRSDTPPPSHALALVLPEPAWKVLSAHRWPGNMRELHSVMHHLVAFTLVAAADALRSGMPLKNPRLQVDVGLVGELLSASQALNAPRAAAPASPAAPAPAPVHSQVRGVTPLPAVDTDARDTFLVKVRPLGSLNAVAVDVERQYFFALYKRFGGDFARMAEVLLGDPAKERAIRLRFNQMGLKVRELRGR